MPLPAREESHKTESLGPYRLLDELGEGGMGRVLRAEHTIIGRQVAIKILNTELAGEPEIQSRFFMEARIVNEIHHPNIVEVTDFGTFEGRPYIVMELLRGEMLSERLRRGGALPEKAAIHIARQMASALAAVHERGIVHRDLKPDNVFLTSHVDYPDFVKILDFGIAKTSRTDAALSHRTQTGTVLGTPTYMSPEQCLGDVALDQRSDIYSLGVVLFELVTGYPPFRHEGAGRLMLAHIQEPPPSAGVSRGLGAVIGRALAKSPSGRFPSMRELREALGALEPSAITEDWSSTTTARLAPAYRIRTATPAASLQPKEITPAEVAGEVGAALRTGELDLPPLTSSAGVLLQMAHSPGFSFPAALEIVRRDPRLGALILRLANVDPYGGRTAAVGIAQAIARLGASGLVLAVVEQSVRLALDARSPRAMSLFRRPWQHGLASAYLARRLAGVAIPNGEPTDAYAAALVRAVGGPLVADMMVTCERRLRFERRVALRPTPEPAWLDCVDAHGAEVAAALARSWGLPAVVAGAIADSSPADSSRLGRVTSLARVLADLEGYYARKDDLARADEIRAVQQRALGLDDADVARARERLKTWMAARG